LFLKPLVPDYLPQSLKQVITAATMGLLEPASSGVNTNYNVQVRPSHNVKNPHSWPLFQREKGDRVRGEAG